jgi:hypothetical protein
MEHPNTTPATRGEQAAPQQGPYPSRTYPDTPGYTPQEQYDLPTDPPAFSREIAHARAILTALQTLARASDAALADHADDDQCDGECLLCASAYSLRFFAHMNASSVEADIDIWQTEARGDDLDDADDAEAAPVPSVVELPTATSRPYWLSTEGER